MVGVYCGYVMATQTQAVDGSEVRFNHGFAEKGGRADVQVTTRALRRATAYADTDSDAAAFGDLLSRFVEQQQYTEGQHAVVMSLSADDMAMLHLAHMIAAESFPESEADISDTFWTNKRKLPTE